MNINRSSHVQTPFLQTAFENSTQALAKLNLKAQVHTSGSARKDPPGQKSVYIMPGDTSKEAYRFSTFFTKNRFLESTQAAVDASLLAEKLAQNGFWYVGYKDRVKCFSCCNILEKFESKTNNNSSESWHDADCEFMNGTDTSNKPILRRNVLIATQSQSSFHNTSSTNTITQSTTNTNRQAAGSSSVQNAQEQVDIHRYGIMPQNSGMYSPAFGNINEVGIFNHPQRLLNNLKLYREIDRLLTFTKWRHRFYPSPEDLAKQGFYYRGFSDSVQCFSCNLILTDWGKLSPNYNQYSRHNRSDCKMVLGTEQKNVRAVKQTAKVVQTAAGVGTSANNIQTTNARNLPENTHHNTQQGQNTINSNALQLQFPCNSPIHEEYRPLQARMQTFSNETWRISYKGDVSIKKLAEAGLFYNNKRDQTKCWYCGGGLHNWVAGDDPWVDHATCFPLCEYVLRNKGISFVRELLFANPGVASSSMQYNTAINPFPDLLEYRNGSIQTINRQNQLPEPALQQLAVEQPLDQNNTRILNLETKLKEAFKRFENSIKDFITDGSLNPALAAHCIVQRYGDEHYQRINEIADMNEVSRFIDNLVDVCNGFNFCKFAQNKCSEHNTAEVPMDAEETQKSSSINPNASASMIQTNEEPSTSTTMHNQAAAINSNFSEQLERIISKNLCKICKKVDSNMVLLPCGHLSICYECSENNMPKKCPICKYKIEQIVRTYMC